MKRLLLALVLFAASFASAGNDNYNPSAPPPMPPSLKGDSEGFSAFVSMPDFLRAKVFNADTVADHHFIVGLAAAYAIQDKIKSEDLADFMVGFIKSFTKELEDDKAAPEGIIRDH
jgi:hypothetical protein